MQHDSVSRLGPSITKHDGRLDVSKWIGIAAGIAALIVAGAASAQGMLLDFAADKVITKYQTATCEELKAAKKEPPSDKEKQAIEYLRNDSQARIFFINKIAAPVLNKMFDCGMIP
jgi:hypothetical protein